MDNAPNVETVYQAIEALYKGQDSNSKEKASIWLGEFQKSIFAWEIADKLLLERRDLESCYFAAQTMRSKIQYSFHELPELSYNSLRDSLNQHLSQCDENTNHPTVTQLALALADLYLQVPTWNVPILDLINQFNSNSNQSYVLLEILTVLAEEACSGRLRMGANRREQLRNQFFAEANLVLEYLTQCINKYQDNVNFVSHIFKCLASWLSIGALPTAPLSTSILIDRLFQILGNVNSLRSLHDAATDCVVQALYLIENLHQNRVMAEVLFARVHELQNVYHLCVAQDDSEKLQNFCRLFTEMAESLLQLIVECPQDPLGSSRTLDLLLDCAGFYDYSLVEITFNVWYRLSELIYQKDSEETNIRFRPHIERLIQCLYSHCRFDSDFDGTPSDNVEFSDFRRKVGEVIKDVIFIIGSFSVFKEMLVIPQRVMPPPTWEEAEAALFIMSVVAKNIIPDEEEVVPILVKDLTSLPEATHVCILYTSCSLLGELCDWFHANAQNLEKTVQFLVRCLKNKKLSAISSQSLEAICSSARDNVAPYVGDFLNLCANADQYSIPNDAILSLLRSTALLLSYAPNDEIDEKVKELCLKQSQPLIQLLTENGNQVDKENSKSKDPVIWLDRLSAIFRHLNPASNNGKPQLCDSVVKELLPIVLQTCDKYQANVRVVEHSCRALRFMIRCMGIKILPLLTPLVEKMFEIYQKHPHSCFLYLGSVLVDEYGQIKEFVPGLVEMLKAFVGAAFRFLEQPGAMQRCPDSIDDLFRLSLRFVQRAPAAFFMCEVCRPLFQCALAAVSVDHREASQSVNKFLVEVIDFVGDSKKRSMEIQSLSNAEQLIRDFGEQLVHNLIYASVFCLSTPVLRDIGEVMFALNKMDNNAFKIWLEKALKALPQKSTLTATPKQLEDFHKSVSEAKDSITIARALKELARLYR